MTYRTSWYNLSGNLETSGGLESYSVSPSSKKVEVFFDFNPATMMTFDKANFMLVDHHRIYRNEGSGYNLVGTYPIYFKLSANIDDTVTSLTVADIKGMTFTDNFYIVFDDTGEICEATSITGSVITIVRAQKNTTKSLHIADTIIYIFSVFDNVPTANLGQACPVKNDYIPVAKYIDHAQERFLCANSQAYPSRMWWSSYNPDTKGGDEDLILISTSEGLGPNFQDVGKDDGSNLNGFVAYINNNLYFIKDRSFWFITGDMDSRALLRFDGSTGGASHKTIVQIPGGFLFLGMDGIFFFNGTRLVNMSKFKIPKTIQAINWAYAYLSHAVYYPKYGEVWFFVPSGTSTVCNQTIVLNVLLSDFTHENGPKCWSIFDWAMSSSTKVIDQNGNPVIHAGDNSGNLLLLDDTNADNGASINAYIQMKNNGMVVRFMRRWISIIENHKGFRRILTDFFRKGNWNITVTFYTDTNTSGTSYTINCDPSVKGSIRDIDKTSIDDRGHYLSIKFSNAGINTPVQIFNYMLHFKEHKIRG
jgi:hypothetical protein